MHIHSYQIHNVLNVYRKQLSQGTAQRISGTFGKKQQNHDRIDISVKGQRQTLFDKISSEIVERITRFEPGTEFEAVLADQTDKTGGAADYKDAKIEANGASQHDSAFTYTLIDEYNQKITQTLPIRQFSSPTEDMESMIEAQKDNDTNSELE